MAKEEWFFSKTKTKLLLVLYEDPRREIHMRSLARSTGEHINAVREALIFFVKEGVCLKNQVGKKIFFSANPNYLFYDELLRMVAKQTGVGRRLLKEKSRLGKIEYATLSARFYQRQPPQEERIDLLIVGTIPLVEVEKIVREEKEKNGREINYTVMTPEEFSLRKKNKDLFLQSILQDNHLVLIGKEN